jgi:cell division GTPase FtsZ
VWGSKINPNLEGKIRATVVLAGVKSPFLMQDDATVKLSKTKPKTVKIKTKKSTK